MEVAAVRNPDSANRIEQLTSAYVQSSTSLAPQQAEKIANLVINHCGMIQSVIETVDISFTVKSVAPNGNQD